MASKCSIVRGDNGEVLSVMIPNPTIVESTTIDAESVMGEKFKESPGNIDEAEQWAKDNNLWIEDYEEGAQYLSQGGENLVYTDNVDESIVRKVNFEVDDVQEFVKSISDFNTMSPNTPYTIKGFTRLKRNHAGSASTHHGIASKGDFAVVLEQPKIDSARAISREEVSNYMKTLGFSRLRNSNDFVNEDGSITIGDIREDNLILSTDGNYHIIDAAVEIEDIQLEMENIKNRSISNGSFMKAPNGNPTNLTERQWLQVRTNNFKNWFGDWEKSPETASKVVDANGEPLVVYHSTTADRFYAFDPNMSSEKVMHFGTKAAADYRVRHIETDERIKTYATFLNIRNIVRVEDIFGEIEVTREVLKDASEAYARGETPRTDNKVELTKSYIDEGYTGNSLEWYRDVEYGVDTLDEMRDIFRKQIELLEDKKPAQTSEEIDGAIYTNTEEDVGNDSYMVFNPNQIKSAEINNGEFNSGSNDIRRQVGDGTQTNSQIANLVLRDLRSLGNTEDMGLRSQILHEAIQQLQKTGLAKNVHTLSPQQIEQELIKRGVDSNVAKQVSAWHGSPHLFQKFLTEFMGTGEGAQAFGWGLYFTDLESIARNYAKTLANKKIQIITDGKIINLDKDDLTEAEEIAYATLEPDYNIDKAIQKLEYNQSKRPSDNNLEAIDILKRTQVIGGRNLYNVTLHKGKAPSEYNWLEWDKHMSDKAVGLFQKFNEEQGIKLSEPTEIGSIEDRITVGQMYKWMSDKIGQKEASLFLLDNGIDGIKYPAESISRGATSDNARGFNYVVFDENAVTIEEIIQFQKEGLGLLPNGFVDLNTKEVFLNQETANLDTPIHEFSHLFTNMLKQTNPQLYKRGLELIEKEGKEYIDFVKKNQPSLKGEALLDEALNQAVGEAGEKIVNKQSEFFQWLQDMWNSLKDMIGLTQYSWNEVKDMNLQQFTEAMAVDLLRGEELKFESEAQAIKEQAIANGTFMKAPNGKDTNLNERQWLTVRTKAFKDWFGDWQNNPQNASKVVDENGEPLVVQEVFINSKYKIIKEC